MDINKGLNFDYNELKAESGSWRAAKNIVLGNNLKSIFNEDGHLSIGDYTTEPIIGTIEIPDGVILFTYPYDESILVKYFTIVKVIFSPINNSYDNTVILKTLYHDVNIGFPIEGIYRYNYKHELEILWGGVGNKSCLLNIDNLPFEVDAFYELTSSTDITLMYQNVEYDIPYMYDVTLIDGGNIESGTYSFAFAYELENGDLTNISVYSPKIVAQDKLTTRVSGENIYYQNTINKSIWIDIHNIDVKFARIKVYATYEKNNITSYYDLGFIDNPSRTNTLIYVFDGSIKTNLGTNNPRLNNTIQYDSFKTVTQFQNKAIFGNLTKNVIDYQKYANNIKVTYNKRSTGIFGDVLVPYDKPFKIAFYKSFFPDEIKALYIVPILKTGEIAGVFNIPGRKARTSKVTIPVTRYVNSGGTVVSSSGVQQVYETDLDPNYGTGNGEYYTYQINNHATANSGDLSYWQNIDEYYPDVESSDIWDVDSNGVGSYLDTNRKLNVRHHKMPTIDKYETANTDLDNIIYLEFSDVKFPKDILELIQGFYIGFGETDNNNITILTQDALIPYGWETLWDTAFAGTVPSSIIHTPDILFNIPDINPTFIKSHSVITRTDTVGPVSVTTTPSSFAKIATFNDVVIPITSNRYLPKDNSVVSPSNANREFNYFVSWYPYNDSLISNSGGTGVPEELTTRLLDVCIIRSNVQFSKIAIGSQFFKWTDKTKYNYDDIVGAELLVCYGDCILNNNVHYMWDGVGSATSNQYYIKTRHYSYHNSEYNEVDPTITSPGYLTFDGTLYDKSISGVQDEDNLTVTNPLTNNTNEFPYRIVYSNSNQTESLINNWRNILPLSYYDIYNNKGEIWKLKAGDKDLYINTTKSLFISTTRDVLLSGSTEVSTAARVLFDREPKEILHDDFGTIGTQSQFSCIITPFGYINCDKELGTINIVTSTGISRISDNLLRSYLKSNLDYIIDTDNPFIYNGIVITFDEKYNRIIITKRYRELLDKYTFKGAYDSNLTYDVDDVVIGSDNIIYVYTEDEPGGLTFQIRSVDDDFIDKSITISYSLNNNKFICHHDYKPNYMFYNRTGVYMLINTLNTLVSSGKLYKGNYSPVKGKYLGVSGYSSYIDILFNSQSEVDKVLNSLFIQSKLVISNVQYDYQRIDKIMLYNDIQCSDYIEVDELRQWYDNSKGVDINNGLFINNFVDKVLDKTKPFLDVTGEPLNDTNSYVIATPSMLNIGSKDWFNNSVFIGKYIILRVVLNNSLNKTIELNNVEINQRISYI